MKVIFYYSDKHTSTMTIHHQASMTTNRERKRTEISCLPSTFLTRAE
jgi:hypothetical protein